jgi:hypothetical protein
MANQPGNNLAPDENSAQPKKECSMPKREHSPQLPWCSASREDLCEAVQCLRDNFITYAGPFVIESGVAAFKVSGYLMTADELVSVYKRGGLTKEGLPRFVEHFDVAEKPQKEQNQP